MLGVILLAFKAAPCPKALPILAFAIPQIKRLCRCEIAADDSFARAVRRDLVHLRTVMAIKPGHRDKAACALVRRYPSARVLVVYAGADLAAPAI